MCNVCYKNDVFFDIFGVWERICKGGVILNEERDVEVLMVVRLGLLDDEYINLSV